MHPRMVVALAIIATIGSTSLGAQAPALEGDAAAVAITERMLDRLGGVGPWARARTIEVEIIGHNAVDVHPWSERFWIDLVQPRGRYEIAIGPSRRVIAWSSAGGWESRDGTVEDQTPERLALEHGYWRGELTVLLRRLASRTPRTRVGIDTTATGVRTIVIMDGATGDSISRLTVNANADPIRLATRYATQTFDRALGPLAEFGPIRFPRWGTTPSGNWRYEHVRVALSTEPPPVSFAKP